VAPRDGICRKRHKATKMCRTKAPKEGQPDSRVKRSQPMRFGLWRERVSLPSRIIVFSTMIYDRSDRAFVFPSNFFSFYLLGNVSCPTAMQRCIAGHHQQHSGISGADGRFRVIPNKQYFVIECKAINNMSNLKRYIHTHTYIHVCV